jgi:hypothetical protein
MKYLQGVFAALSAACLLAASAHAQGDRPLADHWIEIGSENGMTRYIADAALIRQDDHAVIWRMQTYDTDQMLNKKSFRSIKYQVEYNCASRQRRGLYYEMYSGTMGTGHLIALSYVSDHWRAVVVGTGRGYHLACGSIAHPAVVASAP